MVHANGSACILHFSMLQGRQSILNGGGGICEQSVHGVAKWQCPYLRKFGILIGIRKRNFISHLVKNCLIITQNYIEKNIWLSTENPLLKMKKKKKKKTLLSVHQGGYGPFQLIRKVMAHPIFYQPSPAEKNGRSLISWFYIKRSTQIRNLDEWCGITEVKHSDLRIRWSRLLQCSKTYRTILWSFMSSLVTFLHTIIADNKELNWFYYEKAYAGIFWIFDLIGSLHRSFNR